MDQFNRLLWITEHLLGPEGCPWDKAQTLSSTRSCLIEESSELIEAIDLGDKRLIKEELGDLFFVALFLCKLAEKEETTSLKDVLEELNDKLYRRHPHVFGKLGAETPAEALQHWNTAKHQEADKKERKNALDGIPKGLPALSRAQKMVKKLKRNSVQEFPEEYFSSEKAFGNLLWELVTKANERGVDAEHALRHVLAHEEQLHRDQSRE